ncbi:class I SAM-dependent methyltransferase [Bacillus infantis]|uniref:class I SAM-dependent methyltransferase n=1 Tax=Bacillus infantis TaxID=324767 RepID=UPI003CF3EE6B
MFVTTAGRTTPGMVQEAKEAAAELGVPFHPRKSLSVSSLQEQWRDDCIVYGKNRLELFLYGENSPYFFHPNSAAFRIKRLMRGEPDPFLEAARIEPGDTVADCTLGLASDSIIASYAAGPSGKVTGVEGNPFLAFLAEKGLKSWKSGVREMDEAMARIEVVSALSLDFLKGMPDQSADIVYFDPMFEEKLLDSDGIKELAKFAIYGLSEELVEEAKRVARKRIVMKDHFRSERFGLFGFDVFRRKSSKFHFGVLKKNMSRHN